MSTDSNREVVKEIAKCVMSGISGDCWVDDARIEQIILEDRQAFEEATIEKLKILFAEVEEREDRVMFDDVEKTVRSIYQDSK